MKKRGNERRIDCFQQSECKQKPDSRREILDLTCVFRVKKIRNSERICGNFSVVFFNRPILPCYALSSYRKPPVRNNIELLAPKMKQTWSIALSLVMLNDSNFMTRMRFIQLQWCRVDAVVWLCEGCWMEIIHFTFCVNWTEWGQTISRAYRQTNSAFDHHGCMPGGLRKTARSSTRKIFVDTHSCFHEFPCGWCRQSPDFPLQMPWCEGEEWTEENREFQAIV